MSEGVEVGTFRLRLSGQVVAQRQTCKSDENENGQDCGWFCVHVRLAACILSMMPNARRGKILANSS
jgi:hypothetical protein